ncbi:hypothetical protein [Vibrio maerlii]|uniref:hypothetical protein n=1 Tax=Vibrio maerlii TaxID=2231648 RepID=UPI000E3C0D6B|nr:hypothetical protein [Vibrio maerlii]
MRKVNAIFKLLIVTCLFNISCSVLAEPYLYIEGYGKNQSQAERDAKEKLALRMSSTVQVSESSSQTYRETTKIRNGEERESDAQLHNTLDTTSTITSAPINITNMEVVKSDCNGSECYFEFRVNKERWAEQLSRDINQQHRRAQQYTLNQGRDWKSTLSFSEAENLLKKTQQSILVLSSINNDVARAFHDQQVVLESKTIERVKSINISIRSASDMYSQEVNSLLSEKVRATSQGDIIVYIKGHARKGRKNNKYMAEQKLILQVFEARNTNVAVGQKVLSEIGESAISKEEALISAQDKITKILNENSIYTLFN